MFTVIFLIVVMVMLTYKAKQYILVFIATTALSFVPLREVKTLSRFPTSSMVGAEDSRSAFSKIQVKGELTKWQQKVTGIPVYGSVVTTKSDPKTGNLFPQCILYPVTIYVCINVRMWYMNILGINLSTKHQYCVMCLEITLLNTHNSLIKKAIQSWLCKRSFENLSLISTQIICSPFLAICKRLISQEILMFVINIPTNQPPIQSTNHACT